VDDLSSRRPPRPVAGAPAADARDMAKAWLLGLLADAPLEAAGAVPAADLAREAPALCAAVLRALASDAELARLRPGGELAELAARAGALGGAADPVSTVRAVEALRRAAWDTLAAGLGPAEPALVADLAQRLAHVCSLVAEASLAPAARAPTSEPAPSGRIEASEPESADRTGSRGPAPASGAMSEPRTPDRGPLSEPALDGAVSAHDARAGDAPARDVEPMTPWTEPPARTSEPPSWRAALSRRLERQASDGRPFAVLLVEVDDLDRLVDAASGRELTFALERVERAVSEELRPADMLEREQPGRYWLTMPDTGPAGARELGERVAVAAAAAAEHRGVPLTVSIGVAVCPEDGEDADALAAHADEGVWAARAAGVRLA
jgi:diguanylate cyclase (GGDEF)-like protein